LYIYLASNGFDATPKGGYVEVDLDGQSSPRTALGRITEADAAFAKAKELGYTS
jgi:hypothetical protein